MIVHGYKEWGTDVFEPSQRHVRPRHLGRANGSAWSWRGTPWASSWSITAMPDGQLDVRLRDPGGHGRRRASAGSGSGRAESVPAVPLHAFASHDLQGIRKLAPGTMLVVEDGRCRERALVPLRAGAVSTPKQDDEAAEELLELYRAAVKRHLLSDVPVGILLSGGLDSGCCWR